MSSYSELQCTNSFQQTTPEYPIPNAWDKKTCPCEIQTEHWVTGAISTIRLQNILSVLIISFNPQLILLPTLVLILKMMKMRRNLFK
jgi:hypothetical protein